MITTFTQTVTLYAQIVILNGNALVPTCYVKATCEALRDMHRRPSGGALVPEVGQYIYID